MKQENGLDFDFGGWFELDDTAALYTSWEDIIGQVKHDEVLGMTRTVHMENSINTYEISTEKKEVVLNVWWDLRHKSVWEGKEWPRVSGGMAWMTVW